MIIRFYKEDSYWYADIPEYIASGGDKEDLLMVAGAPEFLDFISQKGTEISLEINLHIFSPSDSIHLYKRKDIPVTSGAYYSTVDQFWTLWLCDVTNWLFKGFPNDLFIKIVDHGTQTRLGKDTSSGETGNST